METASSLRHRIVTGPVAALEPALVRHVFAAKHDDPLRPLAILVGETLLRPYLRRRLAELGGPHMNVHVLTAGELGLRLGERRLIAAGRQPLPVLADRVLAHEAALASRGYFDAVRSTPGFAQALHRTLSDLQRAGRAGDELEADAPGLPEEDKVRSLADLTRRHAALRAGHYDADDALAAADAALLEADELILYGLWEAPEILRRAIAGIAEARPVTAYLPTAHRAADTAHAGLRAWLAKALRATPEALGSQPSGPRESGARASDEPQPEEPSGQLAFGACLQTTLTHLQARLGSRPSHPAPSPGDGSVRLVSAPDPSREVRAAMRACVRWAREGMAFHEMAIAYRHAEPYRPLLAAVAREAKLPIYDHAGTPLAELPVGRRTLALLDLLENDLDRASVIAFAADSRLPEATRDRYAGSPAQWDRISRQAGIVRGREQWRERLAAHRERMEQRYSDDSERERPLWLPEQRGHVEGVGAFVNDLGERIAQRPADAAWSQHVAHLEDTFATYLQDHEPVLEAVRALSRLDGLTATVSGERFIAVVRGVVGGLRSSDADRARPGAFRARGINVIDVSSLRHLRFRAVCVLGLAERSFPPPPRQDPLLLDDERELLGLGLRARGADPEPLQFALGVQAAQERLLLSHPRTEHGSGRPLIASSFMRAAAEALAGERISAESLPNRPEPWLERLGADRVGAPRLAGSLDTAEYDRTLIEERPALGVGVMARLRPGAARGRRAWLARLGAGRLTPYEGGLTEAVGPELARHPRLVNPMSPSSLETFATCPMQFFLSRMLGLSELEEPEEIAQITPLERGSLMHTVLERAMRGWLPADPPSTQRRDAHLPQLEQIAREEFAEVERKGLTGYPALWEAEREAILLDLRLWYDAEVRDGQPGRFDAADFEVGFGLAAGDDDGLHTTPDPLELAVGDAPLRFHGRIDRLEWSERDGAFRVIDYKTGRRYVRDKDVFAGGRALQLPVYLHAAADVILGRDWRSGRAEYFYSTRRGGFSRVAMTGDRLAEHREDFERIVGGFSQAMTEGSFPARPDTRTCGWCAFLSVCPSVSDHRAQMARKQDDPRVARLAELGKIE